MKEKTQKIVPQRYFVTKEIQITIALLVVIALLSGVFLQTISKGLNTYFRFDSSFLGVFLTIGYVAIIAFLAIFFSYRLVGPFKRLEHEMKIIAKGGLDKRLSIRTNDDLLVRNFAGHVNEFINNFEEMSKDYNRLNATIDAGLDELVKILETEEYHSAELKDRIVSLQKHIHVFREKW